MTLAGHQAGSGLAGRFEPAWIWPDAYEWVDAGARQLFQQAPMRMFWVIVSLVCPWQRPGPLGRWAQRLVLSRRVFLRAGALA
jgi:hypothetical protein